MSQNNNNKSTAINTVPTGKQAWKIEIPLEGGGTISFAGDTSVDILAAHKSLRALATATCCGHCQSHNTLLLHRQMSGQNGNYTQYFMLCGDCKAGYSFSFSKDDENLLTESFNEEYRGWRKYDQTNGNGNGNSNGNGQSSRQQRNNQSSQSRNQGNQQRQQNQRQQQTQQQQRNNYVPGDEDMPGDELDCDVPF